MVLSSQNKTPKKRGGGAEKARARKAQVLPAPRLTWRRQKGPPPAWLGPRSSAMNLPRPELEVAPREGGGGRGEGRRGGLFSAAPLSPPPPLSFPLRRPEEGSAVPLPRGFCQSGEGRELRGSGCRRRRRRGVFTGRSRTDTSSQAPPPPPAREGAGRASSRAGDLG